MNNDYRDWILFEGVDNKNKVFDISKHSNFINSLNEIEKARFDLALKEMLMNGTLFEHKKNQIFLLTSLGKFVYDTGSFSGVNLFINSELNINEKFSKNLDLNKKATKITIGIAIGTLIVLIVQAYISTLPSTIRIDKESILTTKPKQKTQELESNQQIRSQTSKDSLKKELHIRATK